MYDYLDAKRMRETDNCDVFVETVADVPVEDSHSIRHFDILINTLAAGTALAFIAGSVLW